MATQQTLEFILKAKDEATKQIIKLQGTIDKLDKELKTAKTSMKNMGNASVSSASSMSSSFVKAQAVIMGVMASFQSMQNIIADASAFEQARISFETMLGSADKAKQTLEELTDFAATTPFELSGVVENSKRLLAYGVEAENLTETLKILGDVSLGNTDIFNRVAFAFGQVKTAGQLFGTELRQFTEAGIPLIAELAKNFNVAESEIKDMVSAGKVGFRDVEQAMITMTTEGGKFENLMQKQMNTVQGLWSNLIDIVGISTRKILGLSKTGDILENGLFEKMKEGLQNAIKFVEKNIDSIVFFITEGAKSILNILQTTGKLGGQIWEGAMRTLTSITGGELNNQLSLWKTFSIGLTTLLKTLQVTISRVFTVIKDVTSGDLFTGIKSRLSDLTNKIKETDQSASFGDFTNAIFQLSDTAKSELGDISKDFDGFIDDLVVQVSDTSSSVGGLANQVDLDFSKMGFGAKSSSQAIKESGSKASSAVEKMKEKMFESLGSVREDYSRLQESASSDLEKLKSDNAQNVEKISTEINKLKTSLNELEESFKIDVQDIDISLGEKVIEQREKIKQLQEDISQASDSDRVSQLQQQLQEEESALKAFTRNNKDLQDEIEEAERRASLTSFERFIEDQNKRKSELTNAFEEKKTQLQEEITLQESNLTREQAIFSARRDEIMKTQDTVENFKNTFINSFDAMAESAENRIEFINRKLETFKALLTEAKEIGAGSLFVSPEQESIIAEPVNQASNNTANNQITININEIPTGASGEIDTNALTQTLIRELQLQQLGSI